MKIYTEQPKDWKGLQNNVAKFLSEIGYNTEIERDIRTVRETVNVDVYAYNDKDTPVTKILCECKYWNNPVPKTIIHAFRTTVTDFGANYGIIISKAGFQAGSYEAAKHTNILLLNWDEFQEYFKEKWIMKTQFRIAQQTKPLYDYVAAGFSVFFKKQYNNLSNLELNSFNLLCAKHFNVAFYSSNLDHKNLQTNRFCIDEFERTFNNAEKDFKRKFDSVQEYYNFLTEAVDAATNDFDTLFKEKLRRTDMSL